MTRKDLPENQMLNKAVRAFSDDRKAAGIAPKDIAKELGITTSYLYRILLRDQSYTWATGCRLVIAMKSYADGIVRGEISG